ncbi:MAG: PAS domain-containing protein [Candidatus Sulfotelmatobacter sp.]
MGRRATFTDLADSEGVFGKFFASSNVGLAIFDEQLGYRMCNPYLATSNGTSIESHLGKHVREILGNVAVQAEPAIQRVFATSRSLVNCEIAGALPTKLHGGHWIDNFDPMTDAKGRVTQVAAVVVELGNDVQLFPIRNDLLPVDVVPRSWKDVARYVGTCVKTVQRWEREFQFPIRRVNPNKGAVVFALRSDVDNWLRGRGSRSELPCLTKMELISQDSKR